MTRNAYFNSPFLLGFEHLERLLERTAKSAGDAIRLTISRKRARTRSGSHLRWPALTASELSVTVEENQLVIRGRQTESGDKTFLHRGIAARQFQRAFVLAEGIDVTGAELENGLLSIDLARPKAEAVVRTIDIKSNSNGSGL
jgi:HSP20 family molecular chaperone IbpA